MAMQSIRSIQQLNQRELDACTPPGGSWHRDYAHTAFISFGSLPYGLSEGDIITVFSQYGNPVYINLIRDKETGKSKGYGFLKYEDQRSTDLAVDNLSGAEILGRMIRVDHSDYKVKDGERVYDNTMGSDGEEEVGGTDDTEKEEDKRPVLREERELERLVREHDDEDPMKEMLVREKREEVARAVERWKKDKEKEERRGKRKHRSHRERKIQGANDSDRRERKPRSHRHRSVDDEDNEGRERKRRKSRSSEDRERVRMERRGEESLKRGSNLRDRRRDRSREHDNDWDAGRNRKRSYTRSPSSSTDNSGPAARNKRNSTRLRPRERDEATRRDQRKTLVSSDEEANRWRQGKRAGSNYRYKHSESPDERSGRNSRSERHHEGDDDPQAKR